MKIFFSVVFIFIFITSSAQNKILSGVITSENDSVEFATVVLSNGKTTTTNNKGFYQFTDLAGATHQTLDEFVKTKSFSEVNSKIGYTIPSKKYDMNFEIYGGLKNIFNQYQSDFDIGKNRDSNYVYGPAFPRTLFFGLKISRG